MTAPADPSPAIRPVPPQFDFDRERFAAFMAAHIPGFSGPMSVEKFKGGQSNPTYLVTAGEARYVMRRKPPGKLLPSAHAVDREYRVMTALAGTDVPVPRTYALCEDETVIGTAFYVMDYVPGRIFWDPGLPGLEPAERRAIYDDTNRAIAALHCVDYDAVGLGNFGRTGQYIERQVARWSSQYKAAETQHIEAMEQLIAWLPQNIPPGDETTIVHGDYRLDNLIFHPTEPRILAVLDWELSTLGHPLVDFAYHCMKWRLPPGVFRTLHGIDLASAGFPSEEEYVGAYCRRTGRPEIPREQWEFYIVFSMFRLAGIVQGIAKRAQQGNASSAEAVAMGALARPLAEEGWACVERLVGAR